MADKNKYDKKVKVTECDNRTDRSRIIVWLLLFMIAILTLICVVLTTYLFLKQANFSRRLDELEVNQTLLNLLILKPNRDPDWTALLRDGDPVKRATSGPGLRYSSGRESQVRRSFIAENQEAEIETREIPSVLTVKKQRIKRDVNEESTKQRRKKNKISRKKKQILGTHFRAHVDVERLRREKVEGETPTLGNITKHGFQPNGRIYKIWKPEKWSNEKLFQYNSTTGKVKVKSTGLYLIYAQIMFHSPYVRKSFGIHIDNEIMPYVEALAFTGAPRTTRKHKRHIQEPNSDLYSSAVDVPNMRHKRSSYSTYSQCTTMTVAHIKKNQEVFLKSLEATRSVILKGYLTFWGLVKL